MNTVKVDTTKEIKMTKDYERFNRVLGNRELYQSHVKALAEAFKDNPNILAYNPVLVNEKMEVIDGQHRIEAAIEADIPVYYIVHKGLSLKDIQALNSGQKPWTPLDYARSYAELGKLDYKLYLEFAETYPFNHEVLTRILSQGRCSGRDFNAGRFQIYNINEATEFFDQVMEFKDYYKQYKNRTFVIAFQKLYKNESYHHQHMLRQLSKYPDPIEDHFEVAEYLRELERIYNYKMRDEDQVRFF